MRQLCDSSPGAFTDSSENSVLSDGAQLRKNISAMLRSSEVTPQ